MANSAPEFISLSTQEPSRPVATTAGPRLVYSSSEPPHDAEWIEYLRSLRGRAVSQLVANTAEKLWRYFKTLGSRVATPDAAVTESGNLFMSWDRGVHHLEIEISPTGRYEWFYRNRETDHFGGDYNYPSAVLAPDMLAQFRLVAGHA